MSSLAALPLAELLDRIASAEPTPGGGSVAALAGACGTALAMMVAGLSRTRNDVDPERAALGALHGPLAAHRARLTALIDLDASAFARLMAAYRLAKVTDDEKRTRRTAIQTAMREATSVPLDTVDECAAVLRALETVAELGNPSASSDVAVAIGMLRAAAEGAAANVRINLASVSDEAFAQETSARLETLLSRIATSSAKATAALA